MKNVVQKIILQTGLIAALLIGANTFTFAQAVPTAEVSKFLILVETTESGLKLSCREGCVFQELAFTVKDGQPQAIDQYGMRSLASADTDENLANFIFTIKKTRDGLSLEGIAGTRWEKLNFSCEARECYQFIDQNGMTEHPDLINNKNINHMESLSPNIFVKNMNETIEYYQKIGFDVQMTVPETGDFVWAMMANGKVSFMFQTFASLGAELPEISRQDGGSLLFYIQVKDIQQYYDSIKDKVKILKGLEKTFYGATEFSIQDNNGYILTFAENEG